MPPGLLLEPPELPVPPELPPLEPPRVAELPMPSSFWSPRSVRPVEPLDPEPLIPPPDPPVLPLVPLEPPEPWLLPDLLEPPMFPCEPVLRLFGSSLRSGIAYTLRNRGCAGASSPFVRRLCNIEMHARCQKPQPSTS